PLPGWVCWIFTARQMPPSYSMMLPGRMSTPLIFMSSLGECWKEPRQPLAAGPLSGKQRVGIDRGPIPPSLARSHAVDREMEVGPGGAGIAGMAHASDDLAALHLLAFRKPRRIGRQVGVVIHPLLVWRTLVDGEPSASAVEELLDRPVRGGDDRRALGGHDVDGVMTSSGAASLIIGVDQLLGFHSDNRERETRRRDLHLLSENHRRRILRLHGDDRTAASNLRRRLRHISIKPDPEE